MNLLREAGMCVLLVAAGCQQRGPEGPPELRPGKQMCAECGMQIDEDRCAAASIAEPTAGHPEYLIYDDIGCMLFHERAHRDEKVHARFVRDYEARTWLKAEDAKYLRATADKIRTPMGSGIVAFGTSESATQAQSKYEGTILDFGAVVQAYDREMIEKYGPGTK